MKICICTTPIRPVPTNFPPLGSMAIIDSLGEANEDVFFYNIDYFRYEADEVEAYFSEGQFDIVGISAVVSTAYAYTKYLSGLIRRVSPETIILVGGNLAASAEILLRKCSVDFCVIGDGELTIVQLVKTLASEPFNLQQLSQVKGISFLDDDGRFQFTGYGHALSADQIKKPNWEILEKDGSIAHFISDELPWDEKFSPEWSEGKRFGFIQPDKGCVARCTFCHRFERGYRVRPVDILREEIHYLKQRYNIGAIGFATENFGSNKKVTQEFVELLGQEKLYWRAGAVRVRTVDFEMLKFWKENGCTAVYFGIESGSQKMLDIMEKNATVEMNTNAIRWVHEAGLFTILQFVISMPGETDETIKETIEFVKSVTPYLYLDDDEAPSNLLSVNYAQALPGTPLYEYAREHGYIGQDIASEEQYLVNISNIDAYQTDHFVNYTQQPLLNVLMWRWWLVAEIDAHYLKTKMGLSLSVLQVIGRFARLGAKMIARRIPGKFGAYIMRVLSTKDQVNSEDDKKTKGQREDGYFNIKSSPFAPLFLNSMTRCCARPILLLVTALVHAGSTKELIGLLGEQMAWSIKNILGLSTQQLPDKSLRKIVKILPSSNLVDRQDPMVSLRQGR